MLKINKIIGKFLKNSSQRELDKLGSIVKKINDWEAKTKAIPDEDFTKKTAEFQSRVKKGEIVKIGKLEFEYDEDE